MIDRGQTPRALTRAFAAAEAPALVAVPAAMVALAAAGVPATAGLTLACALLAVCLVMASFEASRPALRQLMPTAVLAAVAAAGRVLFSPLPDVKPVSAIAIVAGATLGRRSGFVVGALAALLSNVFFGQGPWTPWQMYAWGLVGYVGGVLAERGAQERPAVLYGWGFASGVVYGLILNGYTCSATSSRSPGPPCSPRARRRCRSTWCTVPPRWRFSRRSEASGAARYVASWQSTTCEGTARTCAHFTSVSRFAIVGVFHATSQFEGPARAGTPRAGQEGDVHVRTL